LLISSKDVDNPGAGSILVSSGNSRIGDTQACERASTDCRRLEVVNVCGTLERSHPLTKPAIREGDLQKPNWSDPTGPPETELV